MNHNYPNSALFATNVASGVSEELKSSQQLVSQDFQLTDSYAEDDDRGDESELSPRLFKEENMRFSLWKRKMTMKKKAT